jgi:hypothetical protein
MARIASFTSAGVPTGSQDPKLTLAALMARQQQLAEAQGQITPQREMISPWQGAAYLGEVLANQVEQRRAESDVAASREGLSQAMSGISMGDGATPQQIAQVSQYSPELGMKLWGMAADLINSRRNRETFTALTPEEEVAAGLDPKGSYQRSNLSGKIDSIGGSGTNVDIDLGAGSKDWSKKGAEKFGERIDAYSGEGVAAQQKLQTIDQLEFLMQDLPGGLTAQMTQMLRDRFGVSLGEGADKLQAFEGLVNTLVPTQRPPGSGTMSDRDVELFKKSLPSYLNSPEGNRMILATMRGIAEYSVKLGALADQAAQMEDVGAARKFFNTEAAKIGDPLQAWRNAEVQRQKGAGGSGGAGAPVRQPVMNPDGTVAPDAFKDWTVDEIRAYTEWARQQNAQPRGVGP